MLHAGKQALSAVMLKTGRLVAEGLVLIEGEEPASLTTTLPILYLQIKSLAHHTIGMFMEHLPDLAVFNNENCEIATNWIVL